MPCAERGACSRGGSALATARDAAKRLIGTTRGRRLFARTAGFRGRDLVLMFHRLAPGGQRPHEVVPCVATALFRRQIEVLGDLGDIVPLATLLEPRDRSARVRFALTFDDDYSSHLTEAAPVIEQLGVPATCFLSGRTVMGLGAYWWEVLEDDIARTGLEAAAESLQLSARSPADLAAQVEGTAAAERLSARARNTDASHLGPGDIVDLAQRGWTVGFHTVEHPVLTTLDARQLRDALHHGREELGGLVGRRLELLGYPHGKADATVAAAAREAGYRAAWTGSALPMRLRDDRHLLGRYEPGPLDVDRFAAMVAVRLNRLAPDAR